MNVSCAKDHINQIKNICDDINKFEEKHKDLQNETGFLCDTVAFLCDYKRVLEKAIDEAELKI